MSRRFQTLMALAIAAGVAPRAPRGAEPDLAGYKTVETAEKAKGARPGAQGEDAASPVYLGIRLDLEAKGELVVADVDPESPAGKAGVKAGDVVRKVDGESVRDAEGLFDRLLGKSAGQTVELGLGRQGEGVKARALLTSWSRTRPSRGRRRDALGVQVAAREGDGLVIESVASGSAADKAKLKVGEVILKVDDVPLTSPDQLHDLIDAKTPESTVATTLLLAEKAVEMRVKLDREPPATTDAPDGGNPRRGGIGGGGYWTKPGFRLAIVCVEYPDQKHNPTISREGWEALLFSEGTFTKANATGQAVHGSFRDYFLEQSHGFFKVDGKVFDWIEVEKKRADYATGNRMALLTESLDKILERDGKDALKDFDGVFFVYAGSRFPGPRGSLYWPHRSSVGHKGKRWPYFIVDEGGPRMQGLSVLAHEFGHMLGMPDLYARPENPGMEGLGVWCNMAQQPNRMVPQHFSAWVKEKLGWIRPAVIDPTVKQKLVLGPIEGSETECFKVLMRPDGSEYLLLENRRKTGFDKSLPAEGLLIWHVLGNRPYLKESHGVEGPAGPRVFMSEVPYPSGANDAYTPYTTPSSRSPLGGGLPVSITNIRKLPDGRITFQIGYDYQ